MRALSEPFRYRAPGKLVLLGEYAVLDGAAALVMAVDRGVEVDHWPGENLQIETPTGDDRFVAGALANSTGRFVFSDWNPVVGIRGKPGFGGSAAACVVACLAANRPTEAAYRLHHAAQGSGSGVDVAASIHGGLLTFRRRLEVPEVNPMHRKPRVLTLWSGASAKTGPRVGAYLAYSGRAAFAQASEELVGRFALDPIGALTEAGDRLCAMAHEAGIAYDTPSLARIRQLAREYGGAAKASGAGGGDCAVALLPDPEAERAFLAAATHEGLPQIPIHMAGPAGRIFGGSPLP